MARSKILATKNNISYYFQVNLVIFADVRMCRYCTVYLEKRLPIFYLLAPYNRPEIIGLSDPWEVNRSNLTLQILGTPLQA